MPVPDFQTCMLPVLKCFAEGARNVADCVPVVAKEFGVTPDEAAELLPSGRMTVLLSRVHWARTYLSKANLLESPKRNQHRITAAGRALLETNPARIDIKTLESHAGFADWRGGGASTSPDQTPGTTAQTPLHGVQPLPSVMVLTPDDAIVSAAATLEAALRDDLLQIVTQMPPPKFERLILDLLIAMGYGAGDLANSRTTPTTGDGGIDGVIHEDALGLDAVYIQAKRYQPGSNVGGPALREFIGSLSQQRATKGVFVTTADFTPDARLSASSVHQRIVLINGHDLTRLMIHHGVGVRTRQTIYIKGVDADYFDETSLS